MKFGSISTLVSCALVLLLCPMAHAQLTLTLDNSTQSVLQGQTITFSGTLTNTGDQILYLNGDGVDIVATELTSSDARFLSNAPLFLYPHGAAGDHWSGGLFDISATSNTLPYLYHGTFAVSGGSDALASDELSRVSFTVNVTSPNPTPAPSALTTALMGTIPCALLLRRRKK